ncbi:beta-galactosidase [Rhodohalobacter sp. 614A]|uniref:beta-galactosidase n=1 Tax=Rhodohalobacter sp. 614A TaxID=2908649 RepID=UPI001F21B4DC|nr:beta-galactosidase [Rhodohalobacter sp. 614A]
MRQKLSFCFLILILLPFFGIAQPHPNQVFEPDFFPFSVWYSGGDARAPMLSTINPESEEEWRKDLQQIRDLGFNTVRTWVEWQRVEPREGEYHFENLRLLMRLADEVGLKVFIQVYADSAPEWLGSQYSDAKFTTQSGVQVEPQAAPGYCVDHAGVHEAMMNFYTETAKVANEYDNLIGWDLWSEPHIINWSNIDYVQNAQFCYCSYTQSRFRNWLREKYGSLDNLNTAWHRSFNSWNQVSPPRFSTILSYTDYIDWKTFIYEKLQKDLSDRYNAIRDADMQHVVTSHAAVSSIIISPHMGEGATDDFLMADAVDYYGVSLYPKHNHPDRHWPAWRVMNMMDFSRSANIDNNGWYVGELQAGKGTIALLVSDPVTPGDHNVWAWTAISKGARGINIYAYHPMSSGYESGGYGLINQDGSLTDRARNAGKIAQIVTKNKDLFLKSKPVPAQVALVYNPLSQMVGGAQRRADYPSGHHDSLIGYYRVFAENNIDVDFIHREDLENKDLSQYKLVILPWSMMLTDEAANGLKRFVENGGYAVAEARTAWNDERGYASERIPGMGLTEVFGVYEDQVWMREEDLDFPLIDRQHPATIPLGAGGKLTGFLYGSSFKPYAGSEIDILATFGLTGKPALTVHKYGNGEAMMIGTFLGLANHPELKPGNAAFIKGLADWAGVNQKVTSSHDGSESAIVDIQLQENEDGYLLFAINHAETEEEVSISLQMEEDGTYSVRELTQEDEFTLETEDGVLLIETMLPGRDARVWEIAK